LYSVGEWRILFQNIFFKFDKIPAAFAVVWELTNYPPETAAKFITKSRSLKLMPDRSPQPNIKPVYALPNPKKPTPKNI
jgi:hypothetical protein